MFDIVGVDYPCVDLNVNVDAMPKPNGVMRINDLSWQGGGKVASGIVTAARLGASCAIFGVVGDDRYGRFCKKDFEDHGIDTRHLILQKNTDLPVETRRVRAQLLHIRQHGDPSSALKG